MKKISIIISSLLLLFNIGCTKEETIRTNFNDFTWYTSIPNGLTYTVKPGESISFIDLSQGALSHEWTIQEGNAYLSPKFVKGQDLTPYIIPNKGLVTSDTTVFVLFPNEGTFTVKLKNSYNAKVVYPGVVPIEAVKVGDVWVAEKVFTITVSAI
ncbi:hypothetical protein [Flavobacterium sp. 7A]|uniref:hypothetical protein n=1 Tax=Flavobacterium sp. 7A TaxID=2940571 RepID=UPI00222738EA|nr:hypothetical protein [Flavobacterium sp. 7A]MCW2118794.1 hypothetical protein [Flavobacterium sp. 7A]